MSGPEPDAPHAGFTTGACAAAAAKAAVLLLGGHPPAETVEIGLPDGTRVHLPVAASRLTRPDSVNAVGRDSVSEVGRDSVNAAGRGFIPRRTAAVASPAGDEPPPCREVSWRSAEAAVKKDVRGDPDATRGVLVRAEVWFVPGEGVRFEAGEGVGTVTLPGLSVPPGDPAINPGPRALITAALGEVTGAGVRVRISIPGGRELARRTFNPRLGIEGGLSILGTTGWVRPYDRGSVRETVRCAVRVALACGAVLPVMVPGHIGERAARRHFPGVTGRVIEVGNEWDAALDELTPRPLQGLLLVGHPGKLAKLCQGDWDTHSSRSDSALPFVVARARECLGRDLESGPTVEGVFQAISAGERHELASALAERVQTAVRSRCAGRFAVAVALVDMAGQLLGSAGGLEPWR